jgi:hypothetical protein
VRLGGIVRREARAAQASALLVHKEHTAHLELRLLYSALQELIAPPRARRRLAAQEEPS